MKFVASVLLTALLSFIICLFMDWWGIALASFMVALLIHQSPLHSFLTGSIALVLLWGGLSWWIDMKNHHVLSHKIAQVLPFGGSGFLMILVTALIGGLVAGFAALAASYARAKK
ncbi:MAG TPA: hypothetical protein VL307_18440 [Chitinophagaceae bacterium]|nr:hypothetical protein [Chitinophagaceae bacterium]